MTAMEVIMAEVMVMMVIINMMEIEGVRTFLRSVDWYVKWVQWSARPCGLDQQLGNIELKVDND